MVKSHTLRSHNGFDQVDLVGGVTGKGCHSLLTITTLTRVHFTGTPSAPAPGPPSPQLEFPSLDSSLIAAFLSEFDSAIPTGRQLRTLRQTLAELATGADHDERLINEASGAAEGNYEAFSARSILTDTTSSLASPRSTSSAASFSTPLGILQAIFPGVPSARLEHAITNANIEGECTEDVDIGRAIQLLLAQEYMPDDEDNGLSVLDNDHTSMPRREQRTVNAKGKKRRDRLKTVAINNMRPQQPNGSKGASRHDPHPITPPQSSDVDIWTSISSISTQLATLLPSRSESFFKSFFHSPESKSPAAAVRRALTAIINAGDNDGLPLDTNVLLRLQEILRSTDEYSELNAEGQKRFLSDADLCLRAVGSRQDDALDLVLLLRNLADDATEWTTPYRRGPLPHGDHDSSRISNNIPSPIPPHAESLSGPRSGLPPPQPKSEWNVVSRRKRSASANHYVPPNITNGTSTHQISLGSDKDIERLSQRLDELKNSLAEASILAGKAWKGGNSKNLGRQVAMYHVEEVRILLRVTLLVVMNVICGYIFPSRYADYKNSSGIQH